MEFKNNNIKKKYVGKQNSNRKSSNEDKKDINLHFYI